MSNEILSFCGTDTGSNLLTEAEYSASSDRTSGNKPGVASAKLNNKAIRQSAFVASQFAQFLTNKNGVDVLDDANYTKLLAQINAAILPFAPTVTSYLSSSGTHNLSYIFAIASGSATAGATYTNNGITYTVKTTVASGLYLRASGSGAPTTSGTLTKTGGTGDTTITFYAVRAPISLAVEMVGGGGGGGGSGTASTGAGGSGGDTTFGSALLSASGGTGGVIPAGSSTGGAGGAASLGTGPVGVATKGAYGLCGVNGYSTGTGGYSVGGPGGMTPFGGAGSGSYAAPIAPDANTGCGGSGGGMGLTAGGSPGFGGGAGGYVRAFITTVLSTYAYAVGAGGTLGTAGTSGNAGTAGAAGRIIVFENYQ